MGQVMENILSSNNKTILNIQQATDFYYYGIDKEEFNRTVDFPTCVPPWNVTLLKWRLPNKIVSEKNGIINNDNLYNITNFIINNKLAENTYLDVSRINRTSNELINSDIKNAIQGLNTEGCGVKVKWALTISNLIEYAHISNSVVYLSEEGNVIEPVFDNGKVYTPTVIFAPKGCSEKDFLELHDISKSIENAALFALTFCNCKKTVIKEDTISRQVRRQMERKNQPIEKTYTLEIDQIKKIIHNVSIENATGIKHSLHLCRGHFKTFNKENPLFGKFTGTFWWDMHAKGDANVGIINKDYIIKA